MTMDEYMNALLSDEVMNEERSMFKKAREYGREEGINQGIDIGKNEGKKEERILIAKELLKIGIPLEKITIATGLSKEQLKKLEVSTSF